MLDCLKAMIKETIKAGEIAMVVGLVVLVVVVLAAEKAVKQSRGLA